MEAFPGGLPSREPLDAVTGARPAFFPNRDGHGAWVNTAALRLAGIDATTADPADGRIERDASGAPTGALQEGAAKLVSRLLPETTDEDMDAALAAAQDYLLSLGITGWQDAIIGSDPGAPGQHPACTRPATSGRNDFPAPRNPSPIHSATVAPRSENDARRPIAPGRTRGPIASSGTFSRA